jgi:hypothetical protein
MLNAHEQSYVNEFKGNLYEFLVANSIASDFRLQKEFFDNLPKEFRSQLATYEAGLRKLDPELLSLLPHMANNLTESIKQKIPFVPSSIELLGKTHAQDKKWGECDILIKNETHSLPISLKLSKSHSYINTKSAGVKSFFSQYFKDSKTQDDFNQVIERSFFKMGQSLYELKGMDFHGDFGQWNDSGLAQLPGELDDKSKFVLKEHYQELSNQLFKQIEKIKKQDEPGFMMKLLPLMGFSHEALLQVTTFHTKDSYNNSIKDLSSFDFEEVTLRNHPDTAHLYIENNTFSLQLRIKPMNKFTTSSYKVNCAIKY